MVGSYPKMTGLVRSGMHLIGRRGATLIWFGILDLIIALSLSDPRYWPQGQQAEAYVVALIVAPFRVWAVIWAVVGLSCCLHAFRRSDRFAFGLSITIKVLWGTCYVGSWLLYGADRAWLSAAIWLWMAAFVAIVAGWPEVPPHDTDGEVSDP